jgi:malate synthase
LELKSIQVSFLGRIQLRTTYMFRNNLDMDSVQTGKLSVAQPLHGFIEDEVLSNTGISSARFWNGLADLVRDFGARNRQLLDIRDALQSRINAYHHGRNGQPLNLADYESFLRQIGYALPAIEDFAIRTGNVDEEIAHIAGPQLVVPLSNPRYALNAANARWGSLYDALTVAMPFRRITAPCARATTIRFAESESLLAGERCSM